MYRDYGADHTNEGVWHWGYSSGCMLNWQGVWPPPELVPDVVCEYCESRNKSGKGQCRNCGAPLREAKYAL